MHCLLSSIHAVKEAGKDATYTGLALVGFGVTGKWYLVKRYAVKIIVIIFCVHAYAGSLLSKVLFTIDSIIFGQVSCSML